MSDESADPATRELIARLRAQLQSSHSADQHGAGATAAAGDAANRAEAGLGGHGLDGPGPGGLPTLRTFPTVSPDALEIANALLGIAHRAEDALESPSAAAGVRRPADDGWA